MLSLNNECRPLIDVYMALVYLIFSSISGRDACRVSMPTIGLLGWMKRLILIREIQQIEPIKGHVDT